MDMMRFNQTKNHNKKPGNKKITLFAGILLLGLLFLFLMQGAMAESRYVGSNDMYQTIQDAINDSNDGDIIYINDSLIQEGNITVNQSVTIKNNGSVNPIIDTMCMNGFNITVDNITIQNINFTNFTMGWGIRVYNSSTPSDVLENINLDNLTINGSLIGIIFDNVTSCNVTNCNIKNSSLYGIVIGYKETHGVSGFSTCNYVNVSNCNISQTLLTQSGSGINIANSTHCIISNNTIYNMSYNETGPLAEGIVFTFSDFNTIIDNNISSCDSAGIDLYFSDNNTLSSNEIYNINESDPRPDPELGIILRASCNNTINENIVSHNQYGINLTTFQGVGSENNTVYHNSIYNNSIQNAFDNCSNNNWNSTTVNEGNYWGDYPGTDSDGNGIGDTAYNIAGGSSQDLYPLFYNYNSYGSVTNLDTSMVFLTIQNAIDDSNTVDGHTLSIDSGTYRENIILDKQLTLTNASGATPIVDGMDGYGVNITANNTVIQNISVTNCSSGLGIYVFNSTHPLENITLDNITVDDANLGVGVDNTTYFNITDSTVFDCPMGGILLGYREQVLGLSGYCANCNLSLNNVRDVNTGIFIRNSSDNEIYDNTIYDAGIGIAVYYSNNSNNLSLNQVYNNSDKGIWFYNSDYNNISSNRIYNNTVGIKLESSSNYNDLTENTIENNSDYGIYFHTCSNNTIDNNSVNANLNHGIYLYHYSNDNNLTNNTCNNNYDHGIYLQHHCYRNMIENNTCNNNFNALGSSGALDDTGIYNDEASKHNHILNNTCVNNGHGIRAPYSSINNTISNNNCSDNYYGIRLSSTSENNSITNNICNNNNDYGIYFAGSKNNSLINNTCNFNDDGIHFSSNTYNNTISNNTLENNTNGILVEWGSENRFINNTARNNTNGISLENSDNCTLTNNNASDNLEVGISLARSQNCKVENNNANHNNNSVNLKTGIYLFESTQNEIRNNTVTHNQYGIRLYSNSSNNIINNNTGESNTNRAIFLIRYCSNNTISNNTGSGGDGGSGISTHSNNNTLFNNTFSHGSYGITVQASCLNNTLSNNTIFNSSGYCIRLETSCEQNVIENNTIYNSSNDGIYLFTNCCNNTIQNNTIYDNSRTAITLDTGCNNNTIKNNILKRTFNLLVEHNGLQLMDSHYNTIFNNKIYNHTYGKGIILEGNNNNITNNRIYENQYGLYVNPAGTAEDNLIYNNLFNNSYRNAEDTQNNTWNTTMRAGTNIIGGIYIAGNYWSDYTGADLNDDGIGDTMTPYNEYIDNGGDYLPLASGYIYVDDNASSGWYDETHVRTIQEGVNNASSGGYIVVWNGTYEENVEVNKTVTMDANSSVFIDGMGGYGLNITSNNSIIKDFKVYNCSYGIYIYNSSFEVHHIQLQRNTVYNNTNGTYVKNSSNNTIFKNYIKNNSDTGIILESVENCVIYHNNIYNNTNQNASDNSNNNNTWYNATLGEGNYWGDDYTGIDADGDGIGDTNYTNIVGGTDNNDTYPLTSRFEQYYILAITASSSVTEGNSFTVTVKTEGGTTVENANVNFNANDESTDSNGQVSFTAPSVGSDTSFTITATKTGYTTDTALISVENSGGGGSPGGGTSIPPPLTPPTADAGGPYIGYINSTITFDGSNSSDSDGNIVSYEWDFGDEGTGSGVNPTHYYLREDTYTVTLTVTDDDGATGSDTTTVTIHALAPEPPIADTGGPYTGVVNQEIMLIGSGSFDPDGSITNYTWTVGMNETLYGETPTVSYPFANIYQIRLNVTDSDNVTDYEDTTATIYDGKPVENTDGYVVDANGDGIEESYFNTTSGAVTVMNETSSGNYLVDTDGDGTYDRQYNESTGALSPYNPQEPEDKQDDTPWTVIGIIIAVAIIIALIVLIKLGYLYFD